MRYTAYASYMLSIVCDNIYVAFKSGIAQNYSFKFNVTVYEVNTVYTLHERSSNIL